MDEAGSVDPSCRKRTSLKEAPTSTSGGVTSPEWFLLKIENDKKILENEGKPWTKLEEEKLMKLAAMGYNNKMLSKELQRTINSVKTRKQNLRRIAKGKY